MPFECTLQFEFTPEPGEAYEYKERDSLYLARAGSEVFSALKTKLGARWEDVVREAPLDTVEIDGGDPGVPLAVMRQEVERRLEILADAGGPKWTVMSTFASGPDEGAFRSAEGLPLGYRYKIPSGECCHALQLFEVADGGEGPPVTIEAPEASVHGLVCATIEFRELPS